MLEPFPISALALPAVVIFISGVVASYWITRRPLLSIIVAAVKSLIYLGYFSIVFDGTYTFLDDITYIERGAQLLRSGIKIFNLAENWDELLFAGEGQHFSYYLFNVESFRLFGVGYYAPVAVNISLTFWAAALFSLCLRDYLNWSRRTLSLYYVFVCLHPSVIAWSTVMNGKDTFVVFCTSLAIAGLVLLDRNKIIRGLMLVATSFVILTFTRFYAPLFLMSAYFLSYLHWSSLKKRKTVFFLALALALVIAIVANLGVDRLPYYYDRILSDLASPLYGFFRALLTPIPFNAEKSYGFLNLPQLFHWLSLPFALIGLFVVFRSKFVFLRFVSIYFLLGMLLLGLYNELQGPRHRYQFEIFIALFQFLGIRSMIHISSGRVQLRLR